MSGEILVIDLNPRETECSVCGCVCRLEQALPMYEGEVMPDDWEGPWGGMPVCKKCYKEHYREDGSVEGHARSGDT